MVDISPDMVTRVVDIAKRAGGEIMKIYGTDFEVEAKADASPVTQADQIAETLILSALEAEVSDKFPMVGEESVAAGNIPDISGGTFWLVDALDGTKEFIKRNGEFTVNIGLIDDGQPVLGVVHAPVLGTTYWGSPLGAFKETTGGQQEAISTRSSSGKGLVVAASRSHRTAELEAYLSNLLVSEEIVAGSSLKFCLVAEGRADIYPRIGTTIEWDTAAGHGVVRFAGGTVTELDGGDFLYGKQDFKNPHFLVRGMPESASTATDKP